MDAIVEGMNAERASAGEPLFRLKSIPEGAATSVWAGFVAAADEVGGRYCEDCHVAEIVDGPVDAAGDGLYAYAVDAERAKLLWTESERLVGETAS